LAVHCPAVYTVFAIVVFPDRNPIVGSPRKHISPSKSAFRDVESTPRRRKALSTRHTRLGPRLTKRSRKSHESTYNRLALVRDREVSTQTVRADYYCLLAEARLPTSPVIAGPPVSLGRGEAVYREYRFGCRELSSTLEGVSVTKGLVSLPFTTRWHSWCSS